MLKSRSPLVPSIVLLGVLAGAILLRLSAMAAEDPETWKWNDPKELKIPGLRHGDASTKDHIVYGGTYDSESGGNGVRLANIMISSRPEGARFALIRADAPVPKGHPESRPQPK